MGTGDEAWDSERVLLGSWRLRQAMWRNIDEVSPREKKNNRAAGRVHHVDQAASRSDQMQIPGPSKITKN